MVSTRPQRAASARSCVTSTSVVCTAALSSNSSAMMRSPVAVSRLPVGSSANSTAGSPTDGARQRDALLLAAGELARIVPAARGEADACEHGARTLARIAVRAARAAA